MSPTWVDMQRWRRHSERARTGGAYVLEARLSRERDSAPLVLIADFPFPIPATAMTACCSHTALGLETESPGVAVMRKPRMS